MAATFQVSASPDLRGTNVGAAIRRLRFSGTGGSRGPNLYNLVKKKTITAVPFPHVGGKQPVTRVNVHMTVV